MNHIVEIWQIIHSIQDRLDAIEKKLEEPLPPPIERIQTAFIETRCDEL